MIMQLNSIYLVIITIVINQRWMFRNRRVLTWNTYFSRWCRVWVRVTFSQSYFSCYACDSTVFLSFTFTCMCRVYKLLLYVWLVDLLLEANEILKLKNSIVWHDDLVDSTNLCMIYKVGKRFTRMKGSNSLFFHKSYF